MTKFKIRYPNTIPSRIDSKFCSDLKDVSRVRLSKGFSNMNPRELGIPEMTRLVRRTDSWRKVLDELKTRPKKENIK